MENVKVLAVISAMVPLFGASGMNENSVSPQGRIIRNISELLHDNSIKIENWTAREKLFGLDRVVEYQRVLFEKIAELEGINSNIGIDSILPVTTPSLALICFVQNNPMQVDPAFTDSFSNNSFMRYLIDQGYYLRVKCKDGVERLTPVHKFGELGMRYLYERFYLDYIFNYMYKSYLLSDSAYRAELVPDSKDLGSLSQGRFGNPVSICAAEAGLYTSLKYRAEDIVDFSLKFAKDPFMLFLESWGCFYWGEVPGNGIRILAPSRIISRSDLEKLYTEFKEQGFDNFINLQNSPDSDPTTRKRSQEMSNFLQSGGEFVNILKAPETQQTIREIGSGK